MSSRYSFIAVFPLLLVALGVWSQRIENQRRQGEASSPGSALQATKSAPSSRRELLELLDRVVAYEHYYRSVYGHFTQALGRLGVSVPREIAQAFEIRVSEASTDRLLITALSEDQGKITDLVSVDQNFELHANFPVPLPRADYLRLQAMKQLRALREAPAGLTAEEQGVFRGFFKFEVRRDSQDQKIAFAVGIRPPVVGMQLEYGPAQAQAFAAESAQEGLELLPEVAEAQQAWTQVTGQKSGNEGLGETLGDPLADPMTSNERAVLAQKIYRGEMGRYARTWSELSRIANFSELKSQETSRKPSAAQTGLEIEPVTSDE